GLGTEALTSKVTAFRRGLDVDMLAPRKVLDEIGKKRQLFDLGLANELHTALLGPVEALVKDKKHLIVVPSGPLTALPFHLLVTEQPAKPKPDGRQLAAYREAAWLIKRHAIT